MCAAILGNIGSGKSVLSRKVASSSGRSLVEEPVSLWRKSGFLKAYYDDPSRYAFSFQCYALMTRLRVANSSASDSIFDSHFVADKVFVNTQIANGIIEAAEGKWYQDLHDGICDAFGNLSPGRYVYLKASPELCLERIASRARKEESSISIEYLRTLDVEFDSLADDLERKSGKDVLRVNASEDLASKVKAVAGWLAN